MTHGLDVVDVGVGLLASGAVCVWGALLMLGVEEATAEIGVAGGVLVLGVALALTGCVLLELFDGPPRPPGTF